MAYRITNETGTIPGIFTYPQGTYFSNYQPPQIPYPGQFGTQAAGLLGGGFGATPGQPTPQPPPQQIIQPVVSLTGINNAARINQAAYQPPQALPTQPLNFPTAFDKFQANQPVFNEKGVSLPTDFNRFLANQPTSPTAGLTDAQRRYYEVYGQLPSGNAPPVDLYNRKFIPGDTGPLGLTGGYTEAQRRYMNLYGTSPINPVPTVSNGRLNQYFVAPYDVNTPINPFATTTGESASKYGSGGYGGGGGYGNYKYPKAKGNAVARSLRWRVATG